MNYDAELRPLILPVRFSPHLFRSLGTYICTMSATLNEPRGRAKNKTEEEAQRLAISKPQLLSLYHAGVIPGIRVSERIILFDPIEVDAALKQLSFDPKK